MACWGNVSLRPAGAASATSGSGSNTGALPSRLARPPAGPAASGSAAIAYRPRNDFGQSVSEVTCVHCRNLRGVSQERQRLNQFVLVQRGRDAFLLCAPWERCLDGRPYNQRRLPDSVPDLLELPNDCIPEAVAKWGPETASSGSPWLRADATLILTRPALNCAEREFYHAPQRRLGEGTQPGRNTGVQE